MNLVRRFTLQMGILLALGSCATLDLRPRSEQGTRLRITPIARTGPVKGSLQTPKGGQFGTTSRMRPDLDEIGVDRANEWGGSVELDLGRGGLWADGTRLELHGSSTLETTLISQGLQFTEGTEVRSDSALMLYGLGYRRRFDLPVGDRSLLELSPSVGIRAMGVQYRLTGSNGAQTDRRYTNVAPELRLDLEYVPDRDLPLRFQVTGRRTIDDVLGGRRLNLTEGTFRLFYDCFEHGSFFLEAGSRHMLLRDTQPDVQNRIHVDFGPWLGAGVELRF